MPVADVRIVIQRDWIEACVEEVGARGGGRKSGSVRVKVEDRERRRERSELLLLGLLIREAWLGSSGSRFCVWPSLVLEVLFIRTLRAFVKETH
jgi:hypothetical protein